MTEQKEQEIVDRIEKRVLENLKRVYAKKIHRKYYKNQEINGLEMQMDQEQIR